MECSDFTDSPRQRHRELSRFVARWAVRDLTRWRTKVQTSVILLKEALFKHGGLVLECRESDRERSGGVLKEWKCFAGSGVNWLKFPGVQVNRY